MKVAIECPGASNARLREHARRIAEQHPARTPERRAAAACWVVLSGTRDLAAAGRALRTFGSEQTQADAAELLGRLAAQDCLITFDPGRRCYACSSCGGTSLPVPNGAAT